MENFLPSEFITSKLDLKDSISEVLVTLTDLAKISFKIENENIFIERKPQ